MFHSPLSNHDFFDSGSFGEFSHMFHDVGIIQVIKPDGTFTNLADFEEKCTDDAIECSAEDVEDIDLENKSATVSEFFDFLIFHYILHSSFSSFAVQLKLKKQREL